MKKLGFIIVICILGGTKAIFAQTSRSIYHQGWIDFNKNGKKDIYEDPSQNPDKRADDLLRQMNVDEKTCQLATLYGYGAVLKDRLPGPNWKDSVWKDGIANIDEQLTGLRKDTLYAFPYSSHGSAINTIQKFFIEETRLGIPVDFTTEGIRGLNHFKATYFPAQIAQGSSFDLDLVHSIAEVTGKEAKSLGYTNVYSPILDVASDPRWGRMEEAYGCDPFLVAKMGKQAVIGIQDNGIVATCKHFAVYGIPIGGRDGNVRTDPKVAPREMWDLYLEPFRVAFQEGKAKGTMASYNDYDGVPIIGSKYFLTDILRSKFHFDGYVVSDSRAVEFLYSKHHVAVDYPDAAKQVLESGMNVRTDFDNPKGFIMAVRQGISSGSISMETINKRVKEVLKVKLWMGLFDHPYVADTSLANVIVHNEASKKLALRAAHEGIVLLKNENSLLPLNKSAIKSMAIIGPNAKELRTLLSRYGPVRSDVVTVFDGIKNALPAGTEVNYAKGCNHVDKNFPASDVEDFDLTKEEDSLLNEAVKVASKSEVVVLAMGDNDQTVGEEKSRLELKFPGRQELLVRRITALNKPTILLLIGGRPVTLNYEVKHIPAIVETWYLGETTGTAIADILFGVYNPSGKLSVPFPKSVGQIPLSFPLKPADDAGGHANVSGFLFPFGYGLSYTTFSYEDLKIDTSFYKSKGEIKVSCKIKNTGSRSGEEVAQLYINQQVSSVTTYVRKLRGFSRVTLQPGEEKEVRFVLYPIDFSIYNQEMKRVVEKGWFNILVGASSEDIRLKNRIELPASNIVL